MSFSRQRGFFDDEFLLHITAADPDATVYVSTQWGSEWNTQEFLSVAALPYSGPIRITDTTQVRAVAIGGSDPETVESHTYLSYATALSGVGTDTPAARDALASFPVIELSAPPPTAKGAQVPAVVEVFWPDNERPGVSAPAGIQRQGNVFFSGQSAYHRLYFGDSEGAGPLDYELFPNAPGSQTANSYSHINLHGGATDSFGHAWSSVNPACVPATGVLMQDRFYQDLQRRMSGDGVEGQHFLVFDRGVFIGVKNVEAVANQQYMAAAFGGSPAAYAVAEDDGVVGPADARAAINPVNDPYLHRDLDNFIDYHLLQWLSGHTNWPLKNFITAGTATGPVYNWVWDNQVSRPGCLGNAGQTLGSWPIGNPEFDLAVADRVHRHFSEGGALAPASLNAAWDALAADLAPAFALPVTQYQGLPYDYATWQAAQALLGSELGPKSEALVTWLRGQGYVPSVAPVTQTMTTVGGERLVSLTTASQAADIYYTIDGSDPRAPGGAVAPSARRYDRPITLPAGTVSVMARAFASTEWSAGLPQTHVAIEPGSGLAIDVVEQSVRLTNNGQAPIDLEYFRIQGDVRHKFDFARSPVLAPGGSLFVTPDDYLGELDSDQPLHLVDPSGAVVASS